VPILDIESTTAFGRLDQHSRWSKIAHADAPSGKFMCGNHFRAVAFDAPPEVTP